MRIDGKTRTMSQYRIIIIIKKKLFTVKIGKRGGGGNFQSETRIIKRKKMLYFPTTRIRHEPLRANVYEYYSI